jgi:hypothetical protein
MQIALAKIHIAAVRRKCHWPAPCIQGGVHVQQHVIGCHKREDRGDKQTSCTTFLLLNHIIPGTAHLLREPKFVCSNYSTASSKRSELFGYAALLKFLLIVDRLMLSPDLAHQNTQVNTGASIDNSSVVRKLQAFLLGYSPKREYPRDTNILSHIHWLWSQQLRFCHNVSWVKAHQDNKTSFHLLDLPAQLNICANAMATECLT